MSIFHIGDLVRVVSVPANLYKDDPIVKEDVAFFEKCVGNVYRVEGLDFGCLELWTTADSKPRFDHTGDSNDWHIIWIEPECVEPVSVLK